jgi:hypothetical protein|tara:strand:- start:20 stop:532 length:513 start_codon:yes stop_codon:yes gene_type:complete
MKALFITVKDLKAKSIISGNTDGDKLIHFIEVAQDIHIQNYLGGRLYDKMQALIISNEMDLPINSDYKLLRDDYIKPMLTWFTQSEYFPFAMFKIDNGGVSKHRGEESDVANYGDIDRMMSKINDRSEFYTRRFLDYICDNSTKYPEYTNNQNGEMYPDKDVDTFSSWVL